MSFNITGKHALIIAEALAPHVQLMCKPEHGEPEPITVEAAKRVLETPERDRIFVPVSEARVRVLVERLSQYQDAMHQVDAAAQVLEDRMTGERARYIRSTAVNVLAALVHFGGAADSDACVSRAVDLAEALDREIWSRIGDQLDKGQEQP